MTPSEIEDVISNSIAKIWEALEQRKPEEVFICKNARWDNHDDLLIMTFQTINKNEKGFYENGGRIEKTPIRIWFDKDGQYDPHCFPLNINIKFHIGYITISKTKVVTGYELKLTTNNLNTLFNLNLPQ